MNTTKPSAGAVRLARELFFRAHDMAACVKLDAAGRYSEPKEENVLFVAELIDQESGLAELLKAAKGVIDPIPQDEIDECEQYKRLQLAIRSAGNPANPNAETVQSYPSGRWTEKGTV